MIGQEAINQVNPVCAPNVKELERIIVDDFGIAAFQAPVIVFGMDDYFNMLAKKYRSQFPVHLIKTEDDIDHLKKSAPNFFTGIFLFDFAWHFGIDIRFPITPYTFMFCAGKRYDAYTIVQMAGRSQRAL